MAIKIPADTDTSCVTPVPNEFSISVTSSYNSYSSFRAKASNAAEALNNSKIAIEKPRAISVKPMLQRSMTLIDWNSPSGDSVCEIVVKGTDAKTIELMAEALAEKLNFCWGSDPHRAANKLEDFPKSGFEVVSF